MIKSLIASLLVLWIMGFGLSIILQSHPRYLAWNQRTIRRALQFSWRQLRTFARWAWRNYRQFIVGFATGVLAALYLKG